MHDPLTEPTPFPLLTIVLGLLVAILGCSLVAMTDAWSRARADLAALQAAEATTPTP